LRTTPQRESPTPAPPQTAEAVSNEKPNSENTTAGAVPQPGAAERYTPAEKQRIEELKARDREVRAHEAAHKSAAGSLARGAPTYSYQRGPDGVSYAIGGEVQIDLTPVSGNPQATLRKAQQIRAAALAPAQPSAQDYAVAAQAAQMAAEAQRQSNAEEATEAPKSASTSTHSAATVDREQPSDRTVSSARRDSRLTAYERNQQEVPPHGQLLTEIV